VQSSGANVGRRHKLATLACIALLLVATTLEAAHIHAITLAGANGRVSKTLIEPHSYCPLCVALHSPAAPIALVNSGPSIAFDLAPAIIPVEPTSRVITFALYVRPPPRG
jgi:hypothetical protein